MLSGGAMRAILVREPGDERVLVVGDAPRPRLGAADVRIRVRTAGVNRADLLQRQGLYPPPSGASPLLGLECAGELIEVGPAAHGLAPGQRVMALLAGGGYAEEAVVHHGSVLPVPDGMTDEEAGGFPEVFLTAFSNLFMPRLGHLAPGETALVHGGGGGVGSTLRSRSNEDKAAIVEGFRARFGTALARGALRPVVDRVLPLEQAAEAHRLMQASEHFGKIVLRVA